MSFPISLRWTAYIAPKPPNSVTVHFIRQMTRALHTCGLCTCGWTHTPPLHACFQTVCHTMAMLDAHLLSAVADQLVFGLWSEIISRSMHAGLQVSMYCLWCVSSWLTHRHTDSNFWLLILLTQPAELTTTCNIPTIPTAQTKWAIRDSRVKFLLIFKFLTTEMRMRYFKMLDYLLRGKCLLLWHITSQNSNHVCTLWRVFKFCKKYTTTVINLSLIHIWRCRRRG